jgi:cell division protein ZapA (FtsZ GTPase activity inhibitor)
MSELHIKVNIANRSYPLKINRDDEEVVRKAAQLISDKIKEYEANFAVTDKQDLLAMCAMHFVTELVHKEKNTNQVAPVNAEQIDLIDDRLSAYLHTIDVH